MPGFFSWFPLHVLTHFTSGCALPLKPPEASSFSLADWSVIRLRCSLGNFNPDIIFLHQKVQTMNKLSVFSAKVRMATRDLYHVDKDDIFKCNLEKKSYQTDLFKYYLSIENRPGNNNLLIILICKENLFRWQQLKISAQYL